MLFDENASLAIKSSERLLVISLADAEGFVDIVRRTAVGQRGDSVVLAKVFDNGVAELVALPVGRVRQGQINTLVTAQALDVTLQGFAVVQVFEGFDQELPIVTQWLIAVSDFFKDYGVGIIIGAVLALVCYLQLIKLPAFCRLRDEFYLKIPYISYLVKLSNTSRFTRTMSILVSSGVTALDSMHISTEVINSYPIRKAVLKAADQVREGEHISIALENTGYFSPLVLQLIQNGEASGKLGDMLERSARAEENEFSGVTALFIALFEPAMILFMGVVVLFIVVAILIPIFDMNELV